MPFFTDPTTKARATLYTLTLDRGMDWRTACAELDAANAREDANGNTGHINGFYEERVPSYARGRKKQYLVIRKQYQYGEAGLNNNYEMYRIFQPQFGLVWSDRRMPITTSTSPTVCPSASRSTPRWACVSSW